MGGGRPRQGRPTLLSLNSKPVYECNRLLANNSSYLFHIYSTYDHTLHCHLILFTICFSCPAKSRAEFDCIYPVFSKNQNTVIGQEFPRQNAVTQASQRLHGRCVMSVFVFLWVCCTWLDSFADHLPLVQTMIQVVCLLLSLIQS